MAHDPRAALGAWAAAAPCPSDAACAAGDGATRRTRARHASAGAIGALIRDRRAREDRVASESMRSDRATGLSVRSAATAQERQARTHAGPLRGRSRLPRYPPDHGAWSPTSRRGSRDRRPGRGRGHAPWDLSRNPMPRLRIRAFPTTGSGFRAQRRRGSRMSPHDARSTRFGAHGPRTVTHDPRLRRTEALDLLRWTARLPRSRLAHLLVEPPGLQMRQLPKQGDPQAVERTPGVPVLRLRPSRSVIPEPAMSSRKPNRHARRSNRVPTAAG